MALAALVGVVALLEAAVGTVRAHDLGVDLLPLTEARLQYVVAVLAVGRLLDADVALEGSTHDRKRHRRVLLHVGLFMSDPLVAFDAVALLIDNAQVGWVRNQKAWLARSSK